MMAADDDQLNSQRPNRKRYDIAYGGFLLCGLFALFTGLASLIPASSGWAGGIGFLVILPLSFFALVAWCTGIWQTIVLPKQPLLTALALFSVCYILEIMTEFGPAPFYNAINWVYGAVTIIVSLYWFLIQR